MVKKHLRNFGAIHRFPGMEAHALPKDKQVNHLLNRTLLGASFSELGDLQDKALTDIVLQLLHAPFEITWPLKDYNAVNERTPDSKVRIGETWKDDLNQDHFINLKRKKTLTKWLTGFLYAQTKSIRPRMVLFWLNYFPIRFQKISIATRAHEYLLTVMNYSMENFRDLFLAQITGFPLLEYHMKIKPARENLHRFHAHIILSKYLFGDDYTKYVSRDRIKRFTRLLREWSALNDALALSAAKRNTDEPYNYAEKPAVREFLNELNVFTVRLLHNEQVARNLAEKLFQYFVHPDVNANGDMVNRITENILHYDYDIKQILTSILLDEQFYSTGYYGSIIKTPIGLLFGMFKEAGLLEITNANTLHNYIIWEWIHHQAGLLGQSLCDAPDVSAGTTPTGLLAGYFSEKARTVEDLLKYHLNTPEYHYH